MNTSFLTTRLVLIFLFFFTQHTCGMELVLYGKKLVSKCFYVESVQNKKIEHFEFLSQLPPEIQLFIFKSLDNKANVQQISRYWSEAISIKSPDIFGACCNISHSHMSRIFLNAVYNNNYGGVKNILENSCLNKVKKPNLCYRNVENNQSGYEVVLDPYHIAREDGRMIELLKKHNVEILPSDTESCQTTPLIMACLSGKSDAIDYKIMGDKTNIRKALNIIVACDFEKCMQQLINVLHDEFGDLFSRDENGDELERKLLRRACINKSCKVLKILLNYGFCKNDIIDDATVLDEAIKLAEEDNSFNSVVALLQAHDAKTFQQIQQEKSDEEDMLGPIGHPFS